MDLYDYWLESNKSSPVHKDTPLNDWALDVIFSSIDRETGRIVGQNMDFFYHGTLKSLQNDLESEGFRYTEGIACFTRKITYALENFSLMGNYTMIANKSVDSEIARLVNDGIINKSLSSEERAKRAFEYWCQDKQREKLGLLTIWCPPEEIVALDSKGEKIYKRHFSLYKLHGGITATERRKELFGLRGERCYLDPGYLLAELIPTVELRVILNEIEQSFADGKDILSSKVMLTPIVDKALIKLGGNYSKDKLVDDFLISITEGSMVNLVRKVTSEIYLGCVKKDRTSQLANLVIPFAYLDNYRKKVVDILSKT